MNHIYKTVFNASLGTWIAVSELAKGKHKTSVGADSSAIKIAPTLLATGLLSLSSSVYALPTGNELVAGQATVNNPAVNQMQINQASNRAVINWQGFSVGQNEAVHIQQPHAQAALLNRVVGQDASQIQGKIQANGQVYLVNPNGVVFGKTAQVDVGGLVASTHDISNQDFMNGKNHFSQSRKDAKVENHGTINATDGGVVALIGEQVTNTGTINTPKGTTALVAGKTVDLDMKGDGLVEVKVTEAALNAQIENHGAITADGGRVVMTAKAANSLMDTIINQNGIVKARGMTERNGEIILDGGENGTVKVSGTLNASGENGGKVSVKGQDIQLTSTAAVEVFGSKNGGQVVIGDQQHTTSVVLSPDSSIDASSTTQGNAGRVDVFANMDKGQVHVASNIHAQAKQGNGGFIETSAAKVKVADSANVSTKATQGQSGTWLIDPTDFTVATSGGDMTGKAVSNALTGGNFTIQSTAGSQSGNGDININDNIEWVANKLTLNALRNININADMNGSGTAKLSLKYGQGAVAKNNTADYNINNGAKIYLPEGQNFETKLGSDGVVQNYTVITSLGVQGDATSTPTIMTLQGIESSNLTRQGNYVLGADINASDTSTWNGGQGFTPIGTVTSFSGKFDGLGHSISNLTMNRSSSLGGLFGSVGGVNGTTTLSNLKLIDGTVKALYGVGSLASIIQGVAVKNVGSSVNVISPGCFSCITGGLVGLSLNSTISNSFSTGNVTTTNGTIVGGLLGYALNSTVINSYSTSNVTGTQGVGGLVGYSINSRFTNTYAAGKVTGNATTTGGLIGYVQNITVSNSFWDTQSSGQAKAFGCVSSVTGTPTGLTTDQMKQMSTFENAGWSIANKGGSNAIWRIYEGKTYPLLRNFLIPLAVSNISKTYNGLSDSTPSYINSITNKSIIPNNNLLGTSTGYGTAINVGNYTFSTTGLYSNQKGYDISSGTLTINKAPLTIIANNQTKTYGQTFNFNGTEFTSNGLINGETIGFVDLNSLGALANASVINSPYDIVASNATGGIFNPNNYAITYVNGKLTINPLIITVIPQPEKIITVVPQPEKIIIVIPAPAVQHNQVPIFAPIKLVLPNFDHQLVPLQTSTTGIKHAHDLRWFYKHWLNDMFIKTRYAWLFNDVKRYLQTLIANGDVEIVNQGVKLPK